MELIKPTEISARILTLLEESDERVIIVSPYMKISKWYKLVNKINGLKARRIKMAIYVRDDPGNVATYRDLDQLVLPFKKIPHLHSKLYMNERSGIVTSMNLLLSSEINSLEIGYATETWEEYNGLMDFYHRYILIGEPENCNSIVGQPATEVKEIITRIREELRKTGKNSWIRLRGNALHLSTANSNYIILINDGCLRVSVSLRVNASFRSNTSLRSTTGYWLNTSSGAASDMQKAIFQLYSKIAKKVGDLTNMKVALHPGPGPDIILLSGLAHKVLRSGSICGLLEDEVTYIIESVRMFVENTDEMIVP